MLPTTKNFFKPVENLEKRKKVFETWLKHPSLVLCKAKDQKVFYLQFSRFDGDEKIFFRKPATQLPFEVNYDKIISDRPVELLVQFDCDDEKYFFKALAVTSSQRFKLSMTSPLFILQRRQNYRMKIPADFKTTALLHHLDSDTFVEGSSIDLSARGCRLLIKQTKTSFRSDDPFEITLSFPKRKKIKIPSYLRHFFNHDEGLELGFEFHKVSHEIERELFGVLMEIYRDYISKMKS